MAGSRERALKFQVSRFGFENIVPTRFKIPKTRDDHRSYNAAVNGTLEDEILTYNLALQDAHKLTVLMDGEELSFNIAVRIFFSLTVGPEKEPDMLFTYP